MSPISSYGPNSAWLEMAVPVAASFLSSGTALETRSLKMKHIGLLTGRTTLSPRLAYLLPMPKYPDLVRMKHRPRMILGKA
jgi:hypothetical protein